MSQLWLLLFLSEEERGVLKEVADDPSSHLETDSPHPGNESFVRIYQRNVKNVHDL
jgi:hypothetical protein